MSEERFGVCRLTDERGKFVRSHLLPRAFTKPTEPGAPLLQGGYGEPIETRWDSWYDQGIVTREGEDILGKIDDAAIKELRRLKLVWSSWGDATALPDEDHQIFMPPAHGFRRLDDVDVRVLRTFCLSLLWRAAVTSRFEFAAVVLPDEDVELLRRLVVSGEWGPATFYPSTVVQVSTRGVPHNHSPITCTKVHPGFGVVPERTIDLIRFYMDGLAIHMHLPPRDSDEEVILDGTIIGAASELLVTTVTYEQSRQAEMFAEIVLGSLLQEDLTPRGGQGRAGPGPLTKPPRER